MRNEVEKLKNIADLVAQVKAVEDKLNASVIANEIKVQSQFKDHQG